MSINGSTVTFGSGISSSVDQAFEAGTSNEAYYNAFVQPLVLSACAGVESTLISLATHQQGQDMAYTGSDNTVELIGEEIFKQMKKKAKTHDAFVTVSMYQIAREFITDLLNPQPKHSLRLCETGYKGTCVENLVALECAGAKELKQFVREGQMVRKALQSRSK